MKGEFLLKNITIRNILHFVYAYKPFLTMQIGKYFFISLLSRNLEIQFWLLIAISVRQ